MNVSDVKFGLNTFGDVTVDAAGAPVHQAQVIRDVVVLSLGAVLAWALCVVVVARRQRFTMDDLHPPLAQP